MSKKNHFILHEDYMIPRSTLITCWSEDAGSVGECTSQYLKDNLKSYHMGNIEPNGYYTMDGVEVDRDIARFPENTFTYYPDAELVVFEGTPPDHQWFSFVQTIMDVAQKHCNASQIYTLGGMISIAAHTAPRELLTVASSPEMLHKLKQYDPITREIDYYQTPPGHRPTINAYLVWAAQQRNIEAACLWLPVPFYLAPDKDPQALRRILDFLTLRHNFNLDFSDIDNDINTQIDKIAELRSLDTDADDAIRALENNETVSGEDSQNLISIIQALLKDTS
ncbi:MAG: PAC2 family protein [Chloroflexi bacterium]|nr:PAC2 family protein [Chloroflexota bacterium]MBT7080803.1 PAC2 family protein [Chloroflexota bacterium]MBT7289957.1 PAC2 family protein [Chloroflexota bacterium]